MAPADPAWTYTQTPDGAFVTVGGRRIPTDYSERVIELLVARKGVDRMPRYLRYRGERSGKLDPLFRRLEAEGRRVRVLEPGCSAGHLSEAILAYPCVERLVSFDVDDGMIEVCREKKRHFGHERWEIRRAETPAFTGDRFDVVLMSAMMEHVDPALRASLLRECFDRLDVGGLLVVLESQNRSWPFEYHVIRLPIPYAHYLPPRTIYALCRAFGRYGPDWTYDEFAHPNTGWWGTSLRELVPPGVRAVEVTEAYGYGFERYRAAWGTQGVKGTLKTLLFRVVSAPFVWAGISRTALLPAIYAVFRKE